MYKSTFKSPYKAANWWDMWAMGTAITLSSLEAQRVMGLRMVKMAKGGSAADVEAKLMVSEKMGAAWEAGAMIAAGGSPMRVLKRYRTIMRENTKRLTR